MLLFKNIFSSINLTNKRTKLFRLFACLLCISLLSGCINNRLFVFPKNKGGPVSYRIYGKKYYVLTSSSKYEEKGVASWYGPRFHRKRTSSGERYNMYAMTAAHKTLPLNTYVRVTNLKTGRHIIVRVNDRGPFVSKRLIDLSYAAAKKLGMVGAGVAPVSVKAIVPA